MPGRPRSAPVSTRIRKHSEFQEIQARGRRVHTPNFALVLRFRGLDSAPHPRLGITASRKIGGAVARNRAKRLIREAFRRTQELWAPHLDIVVMVKKNLEALKLAGVIEEWQRAKPYLTRAFREMARGAARAD